MVFWLRPHHNWRPLRKADRSPGGSNQMTPTVQCSPFSDTAVIHRVIQSQTNTEP